MTKAYVHSTESFGSVDGPGIRYIIFLQGCPMRCLYCHNPDTWTARRGQEMSADQLLDKAERFRPYWGEEGGITVSGGEALLQIDFLIDLFEEAHRRGITTCLDTSAQPFRLTGEWYGKWERLMQATDTVLLDIKHIDDEGHRRLTGHSNANILACAQWLSDHGKRFWVRHVLVPGITDDETLLHRLADFLRPLHPERIEVLPYHSLGVHKYEQLGLDYKLRDVPAPSKESIERARAILLSRTAK